MRLNVTGLVLEYQLAYRRFNMSTVKITVPVDESEATLRGWVENVSQHIDAGNDVEFVDSKGADSEVSKILLTSAGAVCIWGIGMAQADAKALTLAETGWHTIPGIHGIRVAGTTASIGIHVKV